MISSTKFPLSKQYTHKRYVIGYIEIIMASYLLCKDMWESYNITAISH
jgi:hypothetical protein